MYHTRKCSIIGFVRLAAYLLDLPPGVRKRLGDYFNEVILFIAVYDFMLQDEALEGLDLLTYALIHGYTRISGEYRAYGGVKTMAKQLNSTEAEVWESMGNLEDAGLITCKKKTFRVDDTETGEVSFYTGLLLVSLRGLYDYERGI